MAAIDSAVRTGAHGAEVDGLAVAARRVSRKVSHYEHVLGRLFGDVWQRNEPVTWVDVGAGHGELLEDVSLSLLHICSRRRARQDEIRGGP